MLLDGHGILASALLDPRSIVKEIVDVDGIPRCRPEILILLNKDRQLSLHY
jgi:hypothetical protein